jgi:hypothetical protein
MSLQVIALKPVASTSMMGMRRSALPLRQSIERALMGGQEITLDFTGVEATQSFIDELIGVLIGKLGPSVLAQVTFKGCSPTLKGVINFVVADRARDFQKSTH